MTLVEKPAPVTIIGGFLGAGKTTLLSQVLREARGARIGVLVNDFGDINIDAELISEVTGGVMKLTNGCICCTIRSELTSALFQLVERKVVDHVIIETSGLSDPRAIARSFLELHKQRLIRLDGLVSVVDAENFPRALQEHGELARAQVSAADLIVLAKIDLSGEARAAEVEGKIRAIAPRARIIRASHGEVPLSALLGLDPDPAKLDAVEEHEHEHDHDHDHDHHHEGDPTHGFTTWTFRETRPLHWRTLAPVLAELPAAVFRAKGILSLAERPGDRLSLHVVGGRVHVRTIEPWNDRPPRSEVVFIGSAGVFDPTVLEPRLRASTEG